MSSVKSEKPIIAWNSTDESQPAVRAGLVTTLTQKFFDECNNLVMDIFQKSITRLQIQDYCTEQNIGVMLTGNLCVRDQKMLNYSVDEAKTQLKINSADNALKLHVSGIHLDFEFDYSMWSDPELLQDDGHGHMRVSNCDIDLQLSLNRKDGLLQVDFSEVKIYLQEYNLTLDGSSDLSRAVEILFKNFKKFIQKELSNVLAKRLAKSVEESINQVLVRGGEIVDLGQSKHSANFWNVTLLEDPLFTPNYISFVLDGSYHSNINGKEAQEQFPLMPVYVGNPKEPVKVQLFFSEIAINKALATLFENN